MRKNSGLLAAPVLLILATLSGCASTGSQTSQALHDAAASAAAKAIAEAGINLPSMPAECWRDVPHAALVEGQEPRVTLSKEGYQLNKANAQGADCVAFYDDLRKGQKK